MNPRRNAVIAAVIFLSTALVLCSTVPHYELSRFIGPETCGQCHTDIYEQWKHSMHGLAHSDPLYNAVALHDLKGAAGKDELAEAEVCVKCHTPVGYITGAPKKYSPEVPGMTGIVREGIQCDYCHSITGAKKLYNAYFTFDPGHGEENPGVKRGPFNDSQSDYHDSAFSKFHTKSDICGVCHSVRHVAYGTKLGNTYEEWLKSPYGSKGANHVPCQDCHMRQRPGVPATGSTKRPDNPGVAADGGPGRPHIFTHYFAGGNSIIPEMAGDRARRGMTEELLANCVVMKIDPALKNGKLRLTLLNNGAGHAVPTGVPSTRQVWIELTVKDAAGKIVARQGHLDGKGYLAAGAVVYNLVFGDGKGKAVSNLAKAKEIIRDYRLEP
ncbi:MAG TPA: cytochrome c554 family protein, partial [Spirochaetes bacterium]|nr:cytochrome c554 family protein [Spirochaetota bacterium]